MACSSLPAEISVEGWKAVALVFQFGHNLTHNDLVSLLWEAPMHMCPLPSALFFPVWPELGGSLGPCHCTALPPAHTTPRHHGFFLLLLIWGCKTT